MGLGVYMNNMSEYEDAGQQVKDSIDQETFSPDFKSRNTFQMWKAFRSSDIQRWIGATLAKDTVHEIYIVNESPDEIRLDFDLNYVLLDVPETSIIIGPTGSAHLYGVAYDTPEGVFALGLKTGSQDNRKLR